MSRTRRIWSHTNRLPRHMYKAYGHIDNTKKVTPVVRVKRLRKQQRKEIRAQNRTRFAHGIYEPLDYTGIYWT